MNLIEASLKSAGLIICLLFIVFQGEFLILQYAVFALILFSIGIPHGAIDHLISNPKIDKNGFVRFLIKYLTLIALYIAVWYFFPLLALAAFLLMSAYHFGQTHFIQSSQPARLSGLVFLSRGGFFLTTILLGDFPATQSILSSLIELDIPNQMRLWIPGLFLASTILIQFFWGPKFSFSDWVELLILGPILFFSPLLVSFVVYFGFWHAFPSMMKEYDYLKNFKRYSSLKKFIFQLIPFSAISLAGIAIILFFGLNYLQSDELILLFFVMISVISFPHILYMDQFLKKKTQY